MNMTRITTPAGEELVLLSRADFDALQEALENSRDAVEAAKTMAAVAGRTQEMLTTEEVEAALTAPTPLAFWRAKRGLTQKALGAAAEASQSYIADLENGRRRGDPALFMRLAKALRLRMEDGARCEGRPFAPAGLAPPRATMSLIWPICFKPLRSPVTRRVRSPTGCARKASPRSRGRTTSSAPMAR
jgi:DNA-binding XRE family transcriptional regulator